jgi:hypothetical protein
MFCGEAEAEGVFAASSSDSTDGNADENEENSR